MGRRRRTRGRRSRMTKTTLRGWTRGWTPPTSWTCRSTPSASARCWGRTQSATSASSRACRAASEEGTTTQRRLRSLTWRYARMGGGARRMHGWRGRRQKSVWISGCVGCWVAWRQVGRRHRPGDDPPSSRAAPAPAPPPPCAPPAGPVVCAVPPQHPPLRPPHRGPRAGQHHREIARLLAGWLACACMAPRPLPAALPARPPARRVTPPPPPPPWAQCEPLERLKGLRKHHPDMPLEQFITEIVGLDIPEDQPPRPGAAAASRGGGCVRACSRAHACACAC